MPSRLTNCTLVRLLLWVAIGVLAFHPDARAQGADSQPSLRATSALAHAQGESAWLLVREMQGSAATWRIVVWPPASADRTLATPTEIATLSLSPDAIASVGDRLFLASTPRDEDSATSLGFPPTPSQQQRGTEVLSLRAIPARASHASGGTGMLAHKSVVRSLAPGWRVRSAAGVAIDGGTLAVLVEQEGSQPALQEVQILLDGAWRRVSSPFAVWPDNSQLVAVPNGVGVVVPPASSLGGERSTLWIGTIVPRLQPGPLPKSRPLAVRPRLPQASWQAIELPGVVSAAEVFVERDRILCWSRTHDAQMRLSSALRSELEELEWREIARTSGMDGGAIEPRRVVVPIFFGKEQRSALIWAAPDAPAKPAASTPATTHTRLLYVEFSTQTGRELGRGELATQSTVRQSDVVLVGVVMGYVLCIVALLVFRPNPESERDMLPTGASLAEPLRRFLAGSIDLTIALVVGGVLIGWTVGEIFEVSVSAVAQTAGGQRLLLATLGTALLHGTLGEAFFGKTLGKLVVGIRVVDRAKPGEEVWKHPSVLAACLRNLVKWLVPPLALLAIWTPAGRHRGELYSRTFVIEPSRELDGEE